MAELEKVAWNVSKINGPLQAVGEQARDKFRNLSISGKRYVWN